MWSGPRHDRPVEIPLSVRDLDPTDLPELVWTGGPEHLSAIARDLEVSLAGEVAQLVVALPNGRLVGFGAADFRKTHDSGTIWMLSVHEMVQSLGIGSLLISALEQRILTHGRRLARLGVEHDNPRAAALYHRLGYRECGSELDSWPIAAGRSFVTVCRLLERRLDRPAR